MKVCSCARCSCNFFISSSFYKQGYLAIGLFHWVERNDVYTWLLGIEFVYFVSYFLWHKKDASSFLCVMCRCISKLEFLYCLANISSAQEEPFTVIDKAFDRLGVRRRQTSARTSTQCFQQGAPTDGNSQFIHTVGSLLRDFHQNESCSPWPYLLSSNEGREQERQLSI